MPTPKNRLSIEMQGQCRDGAPPGVRASRRRLERTGIEPIGAKRPRSGAIGDRQQHQRVEDGAERRARKGRRRTAHRARRPALGGIPFKFIVRGLRQFGRDGERPPARGLDPFTRQRARFQHQPKLIAQRARAAKDDD
jgi:hypothetical protein